MQYLKIENGILKQVDRKEEIEELEKKSNWKFDYRLVTASGQYCVVDYDKDQARRYVKALLAKVNKLLEVKLLWIILALVSILLISLWVWYVLQMIEIQNIKKGIAELKTVQTQNIKKETILRPLDIKEAQSIVEQQKNATGATNTRFFNR